MSFFNQFKETPKNELKVMKNLFLVYSEVRDFLHRYQKLLKENNIQRKFKISISNLSEKKLFSLNKETFKYSFTIYFYDEIYDGSGIEVEVYVVNDRVEFVVVEVESLFVNILHQRKGFGTEFINNIKETLNPDVVKIFNPYDSAFPFYIKNEFLFDLDTRYYSIIYNKIKQRYSYAIGHIVHILDKRWQEYLQKNKLIYFNEEVINLPDNIRQCITDCYWLNLSKVDIFA